MQIKTLTLTKFLACNCDQIALAMKVKRCAIPLKNMRITHDARKKLVPGESGISIQQFNCSVCKNLCTKTKAKGAERVIQTP